MAISGCSSGLVVTAVLALLLLPVQYYVPDLYLGPEILLSDLDHFDSPPEKTSRFDVGFQLIPLDLIVTSSLLILSIIVYLVEWIQRKLMERRLVKLNQYLGVSLERLREWDAQQEQLESTLKMVQNATSEYNLLLYLLLRQRRCIAGIQNLSDCIFQKALDDNRSFLMGSSIDIK